MWHEADSISSFHTVLQVHKSHRQFCIMAKSDQDSESSEEATVSKNLSSYSDDRIEQAIRSVVHAAFRTDEANLLTYRRVRTAAEKKLKLDRGSFKKDPSWEKKSKQIVDDALVMEERNTGSRTSGESPLIDEIETQTTRKALKRKHRDFSNDNGDKLLSRSKFRDKKSIKQKRPSSRSSPSGDESKDPKSKHALTGYSEAAALQADIRSSEAERSDSMDIAKKTSRGVLDDQSSSELSVLDDDGETTKKEVVHVMKEEIPADKDPAEGSGSDLSELIDEAPPPTKRKKSKKQNLETISRETASKSKSKQGARGGKNKSGDKVNPQEAEIKRLQSWLVKCGIRKVWSKELASHDTARAKIQHLKDMLKHVGMEGRFSAEKASRIREQRELKADLEAVQEGAKMWGQTESEDSAEANAPKKGRRLARGLRNLDFLGSDDGEETD